MQLNLWDYQAGQKKAGEKIGLPPETERLEHDYIGFLDEDEGRANALRLTVVG